jgi:hypothetical protein
MPRSPQHFRYNRALLISMTAFNLVIGLSVAALLGYLALVHLPADAPLLRAIFAALGLYIPFVAAARAAFYARHIVLDRQGITLEGPLSHAFVSWSDVYVLERRLRRMHGSPDGIGQYAVVVNTQHGVRELVVCDEMLPECEQLVDLIRRYAPRTLYREC